MASSYGGGARKAGGAGTRSSGTTSFPATATHGAGSGASGVPPIVSIRIPGKGGPSNWKNTLIRSTAAAGGKDGGTTTSGGGAHARSPTLSSPPPSPTLAALGATGGMDGLELDAAGSGGVEAGSRTRFPIASGPSDRIGANYSVGHTISPMIYSTHLNDPAINASIIGSASARRVLHYGKLYNTLPSSAMVDAQRSEAERLVTLSTTKAAHAERKARDEEEATREEAVRGAANRMVHGHVRAEDDEPIAIDMSRFPLDLFDNQEFELHSPEEWLDMEPRMQVRIDPARSVAATATSHAAALLRVLPHPPAHAGGAKRRPLLGSVVTASTAAQTSGDSGAPTSVMGTLAYSPVYDGGKWTWLPVLVTDYDPATERFGIRHLTAAGDVQSFDEALITSGALSTTGFRRTEEATMTANVHREAAGSTFMVAADPYALATTAVAGRLKWVRRLHIRFHSEPAPLFAQRREAAEQLREKIKSDIRYQEHVHRMKDNLVAPLSASQQASISRRAFRVPDFRHIAARYAEVMESVLQEARSVHAEGLKLAVYNYSLLQAPALEHHRRLLMSEPGYLHPAPPPELGMIPVSSAPLYRTPYVASMRLLEESFALLCGRMFKSVQWFWDQVESSFGSRRFLDTRVPASALLYGRSQEEIERDDEKRRKRVRKRLMKNLRRRIRTQGSDAPAPAPAPSAAASPAPGDIVLDAATEAAMDRATQAFQAGRSPLSGSKVQQPPAVAKELSRMTKRRDSSSSYAQASGAYASSEQQAAAAAAAAAGGLPVRPKKSALEAANHSSSTAAASASASDASLLDEVVYPTSLDVWERRQAESCVDLAEDLDDELRQRFCMEIHDTVGAHMSMFIRSPEELLGSPLLPILYKTHLLLTQALRAITDASIDEFMRFLLFASEAFNARAVEAADQVEQSRTAALALTDVTDTSAQRLSSAAAGGDSSVSTSAAGIAAGGVAASPSARQQEPGSEPVSTAARWSAEALYSAASLYLVEDAGTTIALMTDMDADVDARASSVLTALLEQSSSGGATQPDVEYGFAQPRVAPFMEHRLSLFNLALGLAPSVQRALGAGKAAAPVSTAAQHADAVAGGIPMTTTSAGFMCFHPSVEHVEARLLKTLDMVAEAASLPVTVESILLGAMSGAPSPLLPVVDAALALETGNHMDERITTCATTLIRLMNARAIVHHAVAAEMLRPAALARRFDAYSWLLQLTTEDVTRETHARRHYDVLRGVHFWPFTAEEEARAAEEGMQAWQDDRRRVAAATSAPLSAAAAPALRGASKGARAVATTTTAAASSLSGAHGGPSAAAVVPWSLDEVDSRDWRGFGRGVVGEWRVLSDKEWEHCKALLSASASGPAGGAPTAGTDRIAAALSLIREDDTLYSMDSGAQSANAKAQRAAGEDEEDEEEEQAEADAAKAAESGEAGAPGTGNAQGGNGGVEQATAGDNTDVSSAQPGRELDGVRKYLSLASAVEHMAQDHARFGFFTVDTRPAKSALAAHARNLATAAMDAVIADCVSVLKQVIARYKHIMMHIASQPTDANGLDNLRAFLDGMGTSVDALDAVVVETSARLDALAEFGRQLSWPIVQLLFAARMWPSRIKTAQAQAQKYLSMLSDRLSQQLNDEKVAFERELQQFPRLVREYQTIGDVSVLSALSPTHSASRQSLMSRGGGSAAGDEASVGGGGGGGEDAESKGGEESSATHAGSEGSAPSADASFGKVPPVQLPGRAGASSSNTAAAKAMIERVCENASQLQERLEAALSRVADFNAKERIFGATESKYDALTSVHEEFQPFFQLWSIVGEFEASRERWMTGSLSSLNATEIAAQVTSWQSDAVQLHRYFKEQGLAAPSNVAALLKSRVAVFQELMPIIESLASKALKDWHWADIGEILGVELSSDDGSTLQDMLDMGVSAHAERVQEIALVANKQFTLEKALEAMRKEWSTVTFSLAPYKNSGTYLVHAVADVSALADDHLVKTQSILSSPYVSHIERMCKMWESKLLDVTTLIENWVTVQRSWLYLEPIFGSEDIMRQMPVEGKKFAAVDQLWRRTMSQVHAMPRVLDCVDNPSMSQAFETAAVRLDEIQKGLNAYLETKRLAFPRFFFLSNDELLEILAETKDPTRVQPHLNKSFEGIASIEFVKATPQTSADPSRMQAEDVVILSMLSAENEKVPFMAPIDPCSGSRRGNVELWMNDVEAAMKATMKDHTQRSLYDYAATLTSAGTPGARTRGDWVLEWPGQVVLAVDQIFWTHGVETALHEMQRASEDGSSSRALSNYLNTLNAQMTGLVALVRGKLTPLQRTTLSALTTIDVHARDVVEDMVTKGVSRLDAFEWFSQLRYYWQADARWTGSDGESVGFTSKGGGTKQGGAQGSEEGGSDASAANVADAKGSVFSRGKPPAGGARKPAAGSAAAQLASMGLGMAVQQSTAPKEDPPRLPVRILNAVNYYAWEYLGNTPRLVITPLTDRCYRTLVGAIHLMYGGAPAGPAGTGKTETTKDLAKAMAIQCVVFNCSDGLDYLAMAKFFKGLASAGAWSCFDEFNRIELEVLSVIAQQILTIQKAKRESAKRFVFEGTTLNMRHSCNIFITMNPGYAGRSELPDNLKALFRPVAMMVPDYALISEIILFSYGFLEARIMARKVVQVLRLSSEQLSSQSHYDYGMRAVKTILVAAGNLRRRLESWDEAQITLRAILDVNVPKFTTADLPLFQGIVGDLFPDTVLPSAKDEVLRQALCTAGLRAGLSPEPAFVDKCIQLYETVAVRHGLMLVGSTQSGKTCVLNTLARALTLLSPKDGGAAAIAAALAPAGAPALSEEALAAVVADIELALTGLAVPPRQVKTKTINPKALPQSQLYGDFDVNTHEWTDGVLANAVRAFVTDPANALKWVVFDGPVDAVWIESMNTVLDDNKKLCLNSGEIIKLTPDMTMMFEVDSLEQASPATVSRCGMVYLEPNQLGWQPIVASWIRTLPEVNGLTGHAALLQQLCDTYVPQLLALCTKRLTAVTRVPELTYLSAFLSLFNAALGEAGMSAAAYADDDGMPMREVREHLTSAELAAVEAVERVRLQAIFVYTAVWSFAAPLDRPSRARLYEQFSEWWPLGAAADTAPAVSADALPAPARGCTLPDFQLMLRNMAASYDVLRTRSAVMGALGLKAGGAAAAAVETPGMTPAAGVPATPAATAAAPPPATGLTREELLSALCQPRVDWRPWSSLLQRISGLAEDVDVCPLPPDVEYGDIIVPTVDSVASSAIMLLLTTQGRHVMAVGSTGTGKTVSVLRSVLPALDSSKFLSFLLQFSARTSAEQTQSIIDAKLSKRRAGVFGPPLGRRAVFFVDDISMPAPDQYGSQPPIELLRQWMDHGGWYDRHEKGKPFRRLVDIQFMAAMATGRGNMPLRYVRHFNIIAFLPFETASLCRIFGSVMHWFLAAKGDAQLLASAMQIVRATVDVYTSLTRELRPTPAKSHYTFNLRDVGRVFQGITMSQAADVQSTEQLVRLWSHECLRVFGDRLLEDTDLEKVLHVMQAAVETHVHCSWAEVCAPRAEDGGAADGSGSPLPSSPTAVASATPLASTADALRFVNFMSVKPGESGQADAGGKSGGGKSRSKAGGRSRGAGAAAAAPVRPYVEAPSDEQLRITLNNFLHAFNATASPAAQLHLVLFSTARAHVTRLVRCLSQAGAHALLLGVGGSGRRSLTRLAAYITGLEVWEPDAGKGYSIADWREDAKSLMLRVGMENKRMVMLVPETAIVKEAMLEDINNVLNTGEIPNLFVADDVAQIVAALTNEAKAAARAEAMRNSAGKTSPRLDAAPIALTPTEVYQYFVKKCARNLHVVLTFSPLAESFRARLRAFPSLVNCCYIDYFQDWPGDALRAVASQVMAGNLRDLAQAGKPIVGSAVAVATAGSAVAAAAAAAAHVGGGAEDEDLHAALFPGSTLPAVINMFVEMQQLSHRLSQQFKTELGRTNHVTPTSYLQLLRLFMALLLSKRQVLAQQERRYVKGVSSIESTEVLVSHMQAELVALQPGLEAAKAETASMMINIAEQQKEADATEAICDREKKVCAVTAAEAKRMADECQADLAEAIPALEAAMDALKTLTKADIVIVKSMQKPPTGVRLAMETVCIVLGVAPEKVKNPDGRGTTLDYWESSKKHLLNDPKFMNLLLKFDRDRMSDEIVTALQPYMDSPDFEPEKIAKASSAAEGLCKWVRAMVSYHRVAKTVEPKRRALAEASAKLAEAQSILKVKEERLAEVREFVANLRAQLHAANERKQELERQVADCVLKLERAQQLIAGLGGEKGRWKDTATSLAARQQNLLGDMLLCAGMINYMGPFNAAYRARALTEWQARIDRYHLPRSTHFTLQAALATDVDIRQWTAHQLPADGFSIDSAVIMFNAAQWPLLIDPQRQANRWIRRMETETSAATAAASAGGKASSGGNDGGGKDAAAAASTAASQLRVLRSSAAGFARAMQQAVQLGTPVLIENVGEAVDPYLDPLLLQQITRSGSVLSIRLGDDVLEYNPAFRLYMTTDLANPAYTPETRVKVNLLNFAATLDGLTDQMLGIVVAAESPELEAQRETLVRETAATTSQLAAIENNILRLLATSEGDILEDENLIQTLKSSKITTEQAAEKMAQAERTQKRIATTRTEYTPVAQRAAALYFVVASMSGVDPMYQFSLEWFIRLYLSAINAAPAPKKQIVARLKSLLETFTYALYVNVCRSLFEKDKLLFSFLMTLQIMQLEGTVERAQVTYFLLGNTALGLERPNPAHAAATVALGTTHAHASAPAVIREAEGEEEEEEEAEEHAQSQTEMDAAVQAAALEDVPHAQWLTDTVWKDLLGLSKLPAFADVADAIAADMFTWRKVALAPSSNAALQQLLGPYDAEVAAAHAAATHAAHSGDAAAHSLKRVGSQHGDSVAQSAAPGRAAGSGSGTARSASGAAVGGVHDAPTVSAQHHAFAHFTPFQRLLLLRVLRPDQLVPAIQEFISGALGRQFVEASAFDLSHSFADSTCDTPLVFVLSPGADPMSDLLRLADSSGFGRKLKIVSLGQGQGPIAEAALAEAVDAGLWVCLQNCHLAASWLPTLERLVEGIQPDRTHPDFRLWLTSMPDKAFPISILQRAIKMTNEPPKGVRANLIGSFSAVNEAWFEDCAQPVAFKNLLFGLCFFHAVVQERRRFGPLGWNEVYTFTDADLSISVSQLRMFLDDCAPAEAHDALVEYRNMRTAAKGGSAALAASAAPAAQASSSLSSARMPSSRRMSQASARSAASVEVKEEEDENLNPFEGIAPVVPFPALQYLVAACNYGGRVTDDKDARVLSALLRAHYGEQVLEPGCPLSESGTYAVPLPGPLSSYMDYVRSLPLMDRPEVFGLHENAAITTALSEVRGLLATTNAVLPAPPIPATGRAHHAHPAPGHVGAGSASGGGDVSPRLLAAASAPSSAAPEAGGSTPATAAAMSARDEHADVPTVADTTAAAVTLLTDLLSRLPPLFNMEEAAEKYPIRHDQSMNTVLVQELLRFNRLLAVVRDTLTVCRDAVQGLAVMTARLEAMLTAVMQNVVPADWHAAAYPSIKPLGSWMLDLLARVDFFNNWLKNGVPNVFWISGFYFPQSFLTGLLQNYARRRHLPIDTIDFSFEVLQCTDPSELKDAPEEGAYVYGLFLEGAGWDKEAGVLCEQAPRELLTPLPVMWLRPVSSQGGDGHGASHASPTAALPAMTKSYACPVYRTAIRRGVLSTTGHSTMWVMNVQLPMSLSQSEDHFVKRSTALLCQTSD